MRSWMLPQLREKVVAPLQPLRPSNRHRLSDEPTPHQVVEVPVEPSDSRQPVPPPAEGVHWHLSLRARSPP